MLPAALKNTTEEDAEEEVTASIAAEEISVDAAAAASAFQNLMAFFALKEEQGTVLRALLGGKDVFSFL